jgi:hypothetical protein
MTLQLLHFRISLDMRKIYFLFTYSPASGAIAGVYIVQIYQRRDISSRHHIYHFEDLI